MNPTKRILTTKTPSLELRIFTIWDDEWGGGRDDDVDMDDMDNFIEYEDEEDGEIEAQKARKEHLRKRKAMRRAMGSRAELSGIYAK